MGPASRSSIDKLSHGLCMKPQACTQRDDLLNLGAHLASVHASAIPDRLMLLCFACKAKHIGCHVRVGLCFEQYAQKQGTLWQKATEESLK